MAQSTLRAGGLGPLRGGGGQKTMDEVCVFPAQAWRLWPPAQAYPAGVAGIPTRPFAPGYAIT